MAKYTVYPLFTEKDEQAVRPVLNALEEKGFSVIEGRAPKKNGTVLFFVSEHLTEESPQTDEFLRIDAQKLDVIPINLDGQAPPELIENRIMARNMIYRSRYSDAELAGRIADALKKPAEDAAKVRRWIIAASVAVLLAIIGIILWRVLAKKPEPEPEPEPAAAGPVIPDSIPPEDVDKIIEIVYVGDEFVYYKDDDGYYSSADNDGRYDSGIAYRTWDDTIHFYSKEDGHEYPFTELGDLSYLPLIPNLKYLTVANVKCELPDLSSLSGLYGVAVAYCEIPGFDGLSGSTVRQLEYHGRTVSDFAPLTGCEELVSATLDLRQSEAADFSGFHPPRLTELWVINGNDLSSIDLSSLGQCPDLSRLDINNVPIGNLQFVSGCTSLERLVLRYLSLRRLDGIETLVNLKVLTLQDVNDLADISAIEGCVSLEEFQMIGYPENVTVSDLSALGRLPHLYYLSNVAARNTDLDFLKELPTKQDVIFILVNFDITDYSGLGAIESYNWLYMNMESDESREVDPAPALQYLQDTIIGVIHLRNAVNVDLSMISHVDTELSLETCDIRDFTTLGDNARFKYLSVSDCGYLQSLDGIEKIQGFGTADGPANGAIYLETCPHLTDWSALEGLRLEEIYLVGLNTLPDFSTFTSDYYYLEGFPDLEDLTCFEGLDPAYPCSIDVSGLENLADISTLYKLKGKHLCIRPEWRDQAEELVATGVFESYEIRYPDAQWHPNDDEFSLLSLDELDTLPKSVLARVSSLCLAGDLIFDRSEYRIEEDWSNDTPTLYLRTYDETDEERILIGTGTVLTDLSRLKDLTGLKELVLYMQPMETLDGIQYLESLESLFVAKCEDLTDVSAAFTLQGLTDLSIQWNNRVTSIEGIQNLYNLKYLYLDGPGIEDLSPVLELPALERLSVSPRLGDAARALGDDLGFELDIP